MLRWRKSWTLENLQGSIRRDLEPAERSVWADLLDLCALSRRWGRIERSEGIPFSNDELSNMFITPLPVVEVAIEKSINEGRLKRDSDGSLVIVHWDKYQANKAKAATEKNNQPIEMPMTAKERVARRKAAAMSLAFQHPKEAEEGINRRQAEDFSKGGSGDH